MRQRLLENLRRVARRLLLRRVLESCAVMAAAGSLCAAVVELGFWLSAASTAAGAAVCALAVLCGAGLCVRPGLRAMLRLDAHQAGLAAGLLIAGGTAGAAGAVLGWAASGPQWGASAVLVCTGIAAGAVLAVARGVSVLQAAVYFDIHGGLDERLATAVEAAERQADDPLACGLYAQGLDALSGVPYRKVPAWKRTRATLGALALGVALCGTMGSLPALQADPAGVKIADLADLPGSLKTMGPGALRVVVVAMEASAGADGVSEEVAEALRASARAVESRDAQALRQALAGLDKALAEADEATRRRIEQAILAAAGTPGGGAAGPNAGRSPGAGDGTGSPDGNAGRGARFGGSGVSVYHPEYADAMRKQGHAAAADRQRVPMGHAWRLSRASAVHALDAGRVPLAYRPIIRKFFGTEP